jgi:hypothetical protein
MTQINIVADGNRPLQGVLDSIAGTNLRSNPVFLLTGTSRNRCAHTVVACNGDIVCDPSLDDSGIIGPTDDGFYWLTFFGALQATDCDSKRQRDATSKRDRLDASATLLCADLMLAGHKRGSFYITIGDGELHVYARADVLAAIAKGAPPKCDYPVEWHETKSNIADEPTRKNGLRSEPASGPKTDAGSPVTPAEAAE